MFTVQTEECHSSQKYSLKAEVLGEPSEVVQLWFRSGQIRILFFSIFRQTILCLWVLMQIFCNNVGIQPFLARLLQHNPPPPTLGGTPSLPGEGQTDSAAQTAILLWLPLFFVWFVNPCSLSLTLHIALKWICLVLAQRAVKLLRCVPIQWSKL